MIKSKAANVYSIIIFALWFFINFLIADPKPAQGDIDSGQTISATEDMIIIDSIRFASLIMNPEAAIVEIVHALGFTI